MAPFDYSREAELFSGFARAFRRQPVAYRRFASAAEAIRFTMEELSASPWPALRSRPAPSGSTAAAYADCTKPPTIRWLGPSGRVGVPQQCSGPREEAAPCVGWEP
jgi:hypothetical protein